MFSPLFAKMSLPLTKLLEREEKLMIEEDIKSIMSEMRKNLADGIKLKSKEPDDFINEVLDPPVSAFEKIILGLNNDLELIKKELWELKNK
jgi:hypothetical protein